MAGRASVLGAANLICTASSSRCKAISIDRLSLFSLTTLLASALIVASLPVLAGAATMLLLDRNCNATFFDAAGGGDPLL